MRQTRDYVLRFCVTERERERIERAAREADGALVGVPDSEWGQAVLAVVVPRPGATITAADVTDFVRAHLAGYKRPRYVEFVDALPVTTATNKVQKSVLRERFGPKYAR